MRTVIDSCCQGWGREYIVNGADNYLGMMKLFQVMAVVVIRRMGIGHNSMRYTSQNLSFWGLKIIHQKVDKIDFITKCIFKRMLFTQYLNAQRKVQNDGQQSLICKRQIVSDFYFFSHAFQFKLFLMYIYEFMIRKNSYLKIWEACCTSVLFPFKS